MSLGVNTFSSMSVPGSSRVSVTATDSRESMRGLNTRLADYLGQVRALQEANSKLEEQIRERVSSRSSEKRDWTQYDKTIAHLREQLRELSTDNAQLMLQIDNARLAADDFKVKFEAEHAVRQGVDQDVLNLRKMIDNTHLSRMQLESEIESLKEELIFLNKNHEEDVASVKGQVTGSSVDVQMEARKGDDLSETIDKIRQQYEKAMQKSREETESWYQAKFDNMTAEVSKSTETIQHGKSEVNDLRRQKQMLEIDLQALRSMNHSLEDNLKDVAGRYAQEMNYHNGNIQQLEAELGQVHAQVARQRAEYQALLNIKIKLEEEIATYQHLLEGTGVDDSIRDVGGRSGGNIRGPGHREDVTFKGAGVRDDVTIKGTGVRDDVTIKGSGTRDDVTIKGTGVRDDVTMKGIGTRDDVNGTGIRNDVTIKGTGVRDDVTIKGPGIHDDVNIKVIDTGDDFNIKVFDTGDDFNIKVIDTGDDFNIKDNGAPGDANSHAGNATVAGDDIVEFSLEQALNAARPVPTPDQTSEEIEEEQVASRRELKLNAVNGTAEKAEEERGGDGGEEDAVVLEEVPPSRSAVEVMGEDVEVKQEVAKLTSEEKQEETEQKIEEKQVTKEEKEEVKQKVEEEPVPEEIKEEEQQKVEVKPVTVEKKEDEELKVAEKKQEEVEHEVEEKQEDAGQKAEEIEEDVVGQEGEVLEELETKPVPNEEEQKE